MDVKCWSIGNGQVNQLALSEVARTLDCMDDPQKIIKNGGGITMGKYIVRRLTPRECERLQGFPDDWSDIGEWTDDKGKKRKTTDGARYKALGNSIALPFWRWLCERISSEYDRTPTMCSLFDGIGGFPKCWEDINGKGTAVWASEIEPFCVAVTKAHFPDD